MISKVQNFSTRVAFTADTGDPTMGTNVSKTAFSMASGQSQKKEKEKDSSGAGMTEYFLADLFAIIIACGIVDAYFHGKTNLAGKKFSQLILNKNKSKELDEIGTFTNSLIKKIRKTDNKTAEKLKKVYEKHFNRKLPSTFEQDVFEGKNVTEKLITITEDLFVNLNDSGAYNSIGTPFLKEINKYRNLT